MASTRKHSLIKTLDETPDAADPDATDEAPTELAVPFVQVTIYAERVIINQIPSTKSPKRRATPPP